MSDNCKQFIMDIQAKYKEYPSELDDNFNMIIFLNPLNKVTISYMILKQYYESYRKSSASRDLMINRAIIKIREIVNQT